MNVNNLKANLTNPARTYLFDVIIPSPVGGGDAETLYLRAQAASIPGRSVGEIKINYKQTAGFKVPGKLVYGQAWEVTFVEGEDHKIFDIIHAWNQQIIHDVDGVGIGDTSIKTDIVFKLLTTKGEEGLSLKLRGAYPQAVGDVAMSYDDDDKVKYSVTFSYDYWEEA